MRDGYVPQEEVPLYESKGRQLSAKINNNCPVGLPPEIIAEAKAKREAKEKSQKTSNTPGLVHKPDEKKKKKKSGNYFTYIEMMFINLHNIYIIASTAKPHIRIYVIFQ